MVAALALASGACGGDDDAAEDAPATSDAAEDAAATSDAADVGDDSGGDGDSNNSEWCQLARGVESESDLLDDVDFTDPEAIEDAFQQVIDSLEDAADSAPEEIEADVELTLDGFNELFDALQAVDFDFLEIDQSFAENPEVEAASDRIEAYNERECGIERDSDVTDDTDTDTSTGDGDAGSDEGTLRDQLLAQFTAMGMTEDQANCLVDNIDFAEVADSGSPDTSALLDLFETCDIDVAELQPGG
jgi:hypothetical protein